LLVDRITGLVIGIGGRSLDGNCCRSFFLLRSYNIEVG
jgi:hypothetical protein